MSIDLLFPKGSMEKPLGKAFEMAGMPIQWKGYIGSIENPDSRVKKVIMLRPQDIPFWVAKFGYAAGITGQDCLYESEYYENIIQVAKLPFTRSGRKKIRLCLVVRQDSPIKEIGDLKSGARIATELPRISSLYFKNLEIKPEILKTHGATEVWVREGRVDAGIEIIDSGKTLSENNLRIVKLIESVVPVLIAFPLAWMGHHQHGIIIEIRDLLLSALREIDVAK